MPHLPMVERIFCCFPLTVGAFMIAVGTLVLASVRLALIFVVLPNTCQAFEDKYLFYTTLVNIRFFCDEKPETYQPLFWLEIFLNYGLIVAGLCLLLGSLLGNRILTGIYLYWSIIGNFLRAVSYCVNIMPLHKTYSEQDFLIMLWGPIVFFLGAYCWLASYSYLESIPLPVKMKK